MVSINLDYFLVRIPITLTINERSGMIKIAVFHHSSILRIPRLLWRNLAFILPSKFLQYLRTEFTLWQLVVTIVYSLSYGAKLNLTYDGKSN